MMKAIAIFNNKGGVGKTTLLCNLAAYLHIKNNKKVLVIDADPQCNTTTYVLGEDQIIDIYNQPHPKCFTITDIVSPLIDGIEYIQTYEATQSSHFGFDIIPGNPRFSACEDFLASEWKDVKSSDLRGIKSTMLFTYFLTLCSEYDYVFFDMGPSLGAINRSILLACDYFITPLSIDVFNLLALDNIGTSIATWSNIFNKGIYKLEPSKQLALRSTRCNCHIKFLGYVEQQYATKSHDESPRAEDTYNEIHQKITTEIYEKIITPINASVPEEIDYKLISISNYDSLIPVSQAIHKPIFDLTHYDGVVGAHCQKVKDFESLMKTTSERIFQNDKELRSVF